MIPRTRKLLPAYAENSMRWPLSSLCRRLALPHHLDAELRFGAGGGNEGSRLPRELQAELDLDAFRGVREVAKLARHGDRCGLYHLERRFETIADRLYHIA